LYRRIGRMVHGWRRSRMIWMMGSTNQPCDWAPSGPRIVVACQLPSIIAAQLAKLSCYRLGGFIPLRILHGPFSAIPTLHSRQVLHQRCCHSIYRFFDGPPANKKHNLLPRIDLSLNHAHASFLFQCSLKVTQFLIDICDCVLMSSLLLL
jgi:hypothetical protein